MYSPKLEILLTNQCKSNFIFKIVWIKFRLPKSATIFCWIYKGQINSVIAALKCWIWSKMLGANLCNVVVYKNRLECRPSFDKTKPETCESQHYTNHDLNIDCICIPLILWGGNHDIRAPTKDCVTTEKRHGDNLLGQILIWS